MASSQAVRQSASKLFSLRMHGPDHRGIVAAYSHILDKYGCAICQSEQFVTDTDHFYQRSLFRRSSSGLGAAPLHQEQKRGIESELSELQERFGLDMAAINWRERRKRVALFVSKYDHCLWEILLRHEAKELECDIPLVVSNHEDLRQTVETTFGIPYFVFPMTTDNKAAQEAAQLRLLLRQEEEKTRVDVVVLARYMQVLSADFLAAFPPDAVLNIHHSFLPAFTGGNPHRRAHERGVKLVGATAHYVTEILDEGPIVDQDVVRVTHRDAPRDLVRKGRGVERDVLVRALRAHLDDRVILHDHKCVVFHE